VGNIKTGHENPFAPAWTVQNAYDPPPTPPASSGVTGGGGAAVLSPTAIQTAPYTAAVNDLALMNVPAGAVTITLPAAPADKAQVGYRAIGATVAVPLVVNAGAGDTIGTSGATTASVNFPDETVTLQYIGATKQWIGISSIKTQASLDARYAAAGSGGSSGPKIVQATNGTYAARNTVSTDPLAIIGWDGFSPPTIGGNGMGVNDVYNNTGAKY
jgi:hypothetical protein